MFRTKSRLYENALAVALAPQSAEKHLADGGRVPETAVAQRVQTGLDDPQAQQTQ